jgi:hypothetical protein
MQAALQEFELAAKAMDEAYEQARQVVQAAQPRYVAAVQALTLAAAARPDGRPDGTSNDVVPAAAAERSEVTPSSVPFTSLAENNGKVQLKLKVKKVAPRPDGTSDTVARPNGTSDKVAPVPTAAVDATAKPPAKRKVAPKLVSTTPTAKSVAGIIAVSAPDGREIHPVDYIAGDPNPRLLT